MSNRSFAKDVALGLGARPKFLPPKYFYDEQGSALFERITELPEYYLARAEHEILERDGEAIGAALGAGVTVVELGPGSAQKSRLLLAPVARTGGRFVGVDLSAEALAMTAATLRVSHPTLGFHAVEADFASADLGPLLPERRGPRAILLMGSNIGNATPAEQRALLKRLRAWLEPGDAFVLGVDLVKNEATLVRAYDDAAGVTAAFNRNVLVRINRELGGRFEVESFLHHARWNRAERRVEMHLESRTEQRVDVAALGRTFEFDRGETIHTESSYKFEPEGLDRLAGETGFASGNLHLDAAGAFAVTIWRARA